MLDEAQLSLVVLLHHEHHARLPRPSPPPGLDELQRPAIDVAQISAAGLQRGRSGWLTGCKHAGRPAQLCRPTMCKTDMQGPSHTTATWQPPQHHAGPHHRPSNLVSGWLGVRKGSAGIWGKQCVNLTGRSKRRTRQQAGRSKPSSATAVATSRFRPPALMAPSTSCFACTRNCKVSDLARNGIRSPTTEAPLQDGLSCWNEAGKEIAWLQPAVWLAGGTEHHALCMGLCWQRLHFADMRAK